MLNMGSRKPVLCRFWKTSPGLFLEICDRICSSWVQVSGGVVHIQERNTKTTSTTTFSRITTTLFRYRSKVCWSTPRWLPDFMNLSQMLASCPTRLTDKACVLVAKGRHGTGDFIVRALVVG
jgi:hypothetical protein